MLNKFALAAIASAAMIVPAAAATHGGTPHLFNQRYQSQTMQIHQETQRGQMTNAQENALQQREDRIWDQRSTFLQNGDGRLTSQERDKLNDEQSRLSHQIYDTRKDDMARQKERARDERAKDKQQSQNQKPPQRYH